MTQGFRKEAQAEDVRLNKYISDAGVCSRREADRLIETGKVTINGKAATLGSRVGKGDRVYVNGQEIAREEEMILLVVHKPRGIVCTTDKRWNDETIYDLLDYPKRVFSVGRLDKDSEGLLLMTNNGDILNKIMRAGNYHEKEYLVTVDHDITPEFLKKMAEGVYLEELDVKTRPCRIEMAGKNSFRIILTQGLNRQIRRMCQACHYRVVRLIRTRIMNIELGDLKAGEYRFVTRREYARLQEALQDSKNPGDPHRRREETGREGSGTGERYSKHGRVPDGKQREKGGKAGKRPERGGRR